MASKLYVGGISYDSTEDSLKEAFSKAGTVTSVNIITDRATGRSKGFGFVEMSSDEEAQNAVKMFNGQEIDGRTVKVDVARPLEPRN